VFAYNDTQKQLESKLEYKDKDLQRYQLDATSRFDDLKSSFDEIAEKSM
jgi:hypothetical protein